MKDLKFGKIEEVQRIIKNQCKKENNIIEIRRQQKEYTSSIMH